MDEKLQVIGFLLQAVETKQKMITELQQQNQEIGKKLAELSKPTDAPKS